MMHETKEECQESQEKHKEEFIEILEISLQEDEDDEFILTTEMENTADLALHGVVREKFGIQITKKDLLTLGDLKWVNDKVINFYMKMLMERWEKDNYPSVYAFDTCFYNELVNSGYASVKDMTEKIDIFAYDLLFIPVSLGKHRCLATVDFRKKSINYYDSLHGNNDTCLMELRKYLESEHEDKKGESYDTSSFSAQNIKDIPKQKNDSECGMFLCTFAEYLSRDARITFTQKNIPNFRKLMAHKIVM